MSDNGQEKPPKRPASRRPTTRRPTRPPKTSLPKAPVVPEEDELEATAMFSADMIQQMHQELSEGLPTTEALDAADLVFETDDGEEERTQISVPMFDDSSPELRAAAVPVLPPTDELSPPELPATTPLTILSDEDDTDERTLLATDVLSDVPVSLHDHTVVADPPEDTADKTMVAEPPSLDAEKTIVAEPLDLDSDKTTVAEPLAEEVVRQPVGSLTILMGPNEGQTQDLFEGETFVGRSLECGVVLSDPSTSRRHFRLVGESGRFQLFDLGSENGTCVNGARVQQATLGQGAQISVGTTLLHFQGYGAYAVAASSTALDPHEEQTNPDVAPPSSSGSRVGMAIAAVVILSGGLFAAGQFAFGWWDLLSPSAKTSGAISPEASAENGQSDDNSAGATSSASTNERNADQTGDSGNAAAEGSTKTNNGTSEVVAKEPKPGPGKVERGTDKVVRTVFDETPDELLALGVDPSTAKSPDASAATAEGTGDGSVAAVEKGGDGPVAGQPPAEANTAGTPADMGAEPPAGADAMASIDALVQAKKLDEAQAALVKLAQTGVNIQDKVRTIAEARGHAMLLGSIERAMADEKFPEALALASRIPASSPYRIDANTLVERVKKAQAPAETLVDTTSAKGHPDMPPEELATDAVMGFFDAITSGDAELQKTLPSLLVTEADCAKAPTTQREDCVRSVAARSTLVEQWIKQWQGKALSEMTAPTPVTDRSEWGGIKIWTLKLTLEGLDPVDLFVLQLSSERFAMWFPVELPPK